MKHEQISDEARVAWAAGLFEGEGCWNYYSTRTNKVQAQARLAMTDFDVVERFAEIVGFGSTRERPIRPDRAHEKPVLEWYTQKRSHVREMIVMFRPFLGKRRLARAEELMALGEAKPMNERTHCANGHPYEGENLILEPIMRSGRRYFARRCKICRTQQSRDRARKRLGVTPDRFRV